MSAIKESYDKIVSNFRMALSDTSSPVFHDLSVTSDYEQKLQKYLYDLYVTAFNRYENYAIAIGKQPEELTYDDISNIKVKEGDLTFYFSASDGYPTIKTNNKAGKGSTLTSEATRKYINKYLKNV
jgi:hypothetical protein